MNITEAIAAEHATFMSTFHQIELVLPGVKSQAEISTIAAIVAGLLAGHAQLETDLAFVALDHALLHKGQLKTIHREHHEMDERLHQVQGAGTCKQARRLLRSAMRASVRHFRDEERYILPALELALKPETLAALGKGFEEARMGKAQPREEQALSG
jgi:hypothetical protein